MRTEDLSQEVNLGEQILRVVLQVLLVAQGPLIAEEQLKIRDERGIFPREIGKVPLPLVSGELEHLVPGGG